MLSLTGCLNFGFYSLPLQVSAHEFKSISEPFPQVEASLPFPSSPSLSFRFEILGFLLKLVESIAAMEWDGFVLMLRGRLVGWVHLYISSQSVLAKSLCFQGYSSLFFSLSKAL